MKVEMQNKAGTIELADSLFGAAYNESLVHQVLTAYMAGARAGTKAQKTRAEVRGGGEKPWRQKGTGRARAGSIRSPIWIGGGKTFAARPRDHDQKVNRKMYRAALRSMLSELLRQERLVVTSEFAVDEPRTKAVLAKLGELGVDRGLLVLEGYDEKVWLGARNLPHVDVVEAVSVDPYRLAAAERIVLTAAAAKMLEERLT